MQTLCVGEHVTVVQRGRSPRSVRISSVTPWRVTFEFPEALLVDTEIAFEREAGGRKVQAKVARYNRLAGGVVEIVAEPA